MSYASLAATAAGLLTKFGAVTTLRKPVIAVPDEKTDKTTLTSPGTYTATVVILPSSLKADTVEALTFIKNKTRTAYISPTLGVDPAQNDELLWEGVWWKIDGVSPLRPAGSITLLYSANISIP